MWNVGPIVVRSRVAERWSSATSSETESDFLIIWHHQAAKLEETEGLWAESPQHDHRVFPVWIISKICFLLRQHKVLIFKLATDCEDVDMPDSVVAALYIFFLQKLKWVNKTSRALFLYLPFFLFILTEIRGERSDCIIIHAMRLLLPLSASSHQLRSVELQKAAKCRVGHLWNLCFSFLLFSEKLFCWLIVHNVALITVVLPAWLLSIVSVWTLRISCLGHFDVSDATFKLSYLMKKKQKNTFTRRRSFLQV